MSQAPPTMESIAPAVRAVFVSILFSLALAAVKITTGVTGNSWALIADGIESITDVVTSLAVLGALVFSLRPPDEKHPYGHGKAETAAGVFVALCLLGAAAVITFQSILEIRNPGLPPEWFTLPVLGAVIAVKTGAFLMLRRSGQKTNSSAVQNDSWHQASDAITSVAAFIGISLALALGPEWSAADEWAALVACLVIAWNGMVLLNRGVQDLMDAAPEESVVNSLRRTAEGVPGVEAVEKIRVRRSGITHQMDIHIEVESELTVAEGHDIAGAVKAMLLKSRHHVSDVTVHVEPHAAAPDVERENGDRR